MRFFFFAFKNCIRKLRSENFKESQEAVFMSVSSTCGSILVNFSMRVLKALSDIIFL